MPKKGGTQTPKLLTGVLKLVEGNRSAQKADTRNTYTRE